MPAQVSISPGTSKNVLTSLSSASKQVWQKLSKSGWPHRPGADAASHSAASLGPQYSDKDWQLPKMTSTQSWVLRIWKVNTRLYPNSFIWGAYITLQEELKQNIHIFHVSIWGNILDWGLSCFLTQSVLGRPHLQLREVGHHFWPTPCYPQLGNHFPDTSEFKKQKHNCRTSRFWVFVFFVLIFKNFFK